MGSSLLLRRETMIGSKIQGHSMRRDDSSLMQA